MSERMTAEEFRDARACLALTTSALSDYLATVTGRTQRADTIRKWESGASLIPYGVPNDLGAVIELRLTELQDLGEQLNRDFPDTRP